MKIKEFLNIELNEKNLENLQSNIYLRNNQLLKEIISYLSQKKAKKEIFLSGKNLTDKLLTEIEQNETNENLISDEKFPNLLNLKGNEISIEMSEFDNKGSLKKAKKFSEEINIEEEILEEDLKGPELFDLSSSDLNYIDLWSSIKKIILMCCAVLAVIFYISIPLIVSSYHLHDK